MTSVTGVIYSKDKAYHELENAGVMNYITSNNYKGNGLLFYKQHKQGNFE
jgi:hypothetical protein